MKIPFYPTVLKSGLALGLSLSIILILRSIFSTIIAKPLIYNSVSLMLISTILVFLFKGSSKKKYSTLLKKGVLVGTFGGLFMSLFFLFYTNFIDEFYFQNIAILQSNQLRLLGYDEMLIDRFLFEAEFAKSNHLFEFGLFFVTLIETVVIALILAPFFSFNKQYP